MKVSLHTKEALRTNLWFVPACLVASAVALFVVTAMVDRSGLVHSKIAADAGRQILTAMGAAVITVVGLVFSIVIVALTLAATQFGPRMLRNFIRDRGTQFTLGAFVATFVYCVLSLATNVRLSVWVAFALVLVDSVLLIYFIHHIARSIQLPVVVADIAADLKHAIDAHAGHEKPPELPDGAPIVARTSGYLQFVEHDRLVRIAVEEDAVVRLLYRPGHFVTSGSAFAIVDPPTAAAAFERELDRAHITGPYRTLAQDLTFAIDQIVEIAIRALSPAVNDTFTAMTCVDWLGDGLSDITTRGLEPLIHRDRGGVVRVVDATIGYDRIVDRAFDKIRQAGVGMPAIAIRQLAMLARVMRVATTNEQRDVLQSQADMILRSSESSIPERNDRADVRRRYDAVLEAAALGAR